MPGKVWSSWVSCGSFMALNASTFSRSEPSTSNNMPKNVILVSLIWHFCKLETCCRSTNIMLCRYVLHHVLSSRTVYCNACYLQCQLLLLKNILANTQSKRKTDISESPKWKWAFEVFKVRGLFIQPYRPVTMAGIQL